MSEKDVAIAGIGYLGRRLLEALQNRPTTAKTSAKTIALSRREVAGAESTIRIDLDESISAAVALDRPYALVYTIPPPPTGEDDPRLDRLFERLKNPPSRLVLISTTGVYGDRGGKIVTETDAVHPQTDRAKRRVAAEAVARRFCEANDCALIVLRVPGIYGPGRLGIERLAEGGEVLRDEDSGPGNRIHVDDLVQCCIAALSDSAAPGIYNVGDGDHRSSGAFSRAVAEQAGLSAPVTLSLIEAKARWSPMRLSFATESRRVGTTKMREKLGVTPRYANAEDGIRASLCG